jgi:hypothetical protein
MQERCTQQTGCIGPAAHVFRISATVWAASRNFFQVHALIESAALFSPLDDVVEFLASKNSPTEEYQKQHRSRVAAQGETR